MRLCGTLARRLTKPGTRALIGSWALRLAGLGAVNLGWHSVAYSNVAMICASASILLLWWAMNRRLRDAQEQARREYQLAAAREAVNRATMRAACEAAGISPAARRGPAGETTGLYLAWDADRPQAVRWAPPRLAAEDTAS